MLFIITATISSLAQTCTTITGEYWIRPHNQILLIMAKIFKIEKQTALKYPILSTVIVAAIGIAMLFVDLQISGSQKTSSLSSLDIQRGMLGAG